MGSCVVRQIDRKHAEAIKSEEDHSDAFRKGILSTKMSKPFLSQRYDTLDKTQLSTDQLIRLEIIQERIAVVTLLGSSDEALPWGTLLREHRLNSLSVQAVNSVLTTVLSNNDITALVVTAEGKFFCNGLDLKWLESNLETADRFQKDVEKLLARILCLPLPTIAAINGHFCAAGAMLGLAFDYRFQCERGLFFVPAVDLGLTYSPGMTSLMKCKTPVHMHNDMIVFATRYTPPDLERERIILNVVAADQLVNVAVNFALELTAKGRFHGPTYRQTLQQIKMNTYNETFTLLMDNQVHGMGFAQGSWDDMGKSKI
jgi:enoyl-CoA hydratase/carnithine racemase